MLTGNCSYCFIAVISVPQPGNDFNTGWICTRFIWNGISLVISPFTEYSVQTFNSGKASSTSALVITILVTPLIMQANLSATPSIHPQRRGRPVVAPNSFPVFRSSSPVASSSSVGKGPPPTRVQYALLTPITSRIFWGATPRPVQTPAEIVLEEVTKGKVPKSTSSILPWAPSASTVLPCAILSLIKYSPLTILNCRMNSSPSKNSSSHSERSS